MVSEADLEGATSESDDILIKASPTLKPIIIKAILVGTVIGILVFVIRSQFPGVPIEIYAAVVALGGVLILRYVLQVFILSKTTYRMTSDSISREFSLLYKQERKVLPLKQLRGYEVTKSRTESLLGFGTIRFLTTGTGRGIGFLSFDHVDRPNEIGDAAREYADVDMS